MIINHSHSFVFVHVPKAAGTSLSHALSNFATYRDQEIGGTPFGELIQPYMKRNFKLSKHASAVEVRAAMGEHQFYSYYSFAFVRNPYTRAYSIYNYLKRQYATKTDSFWKHIAPFENFAHFVRSDYFQSDGVDRIFRPQTFWTSLPQGRSLNFIGSVEHIDTDIQAVIKQIRLNTSSSQLKKDDKVDMKVTEENRSTSSSAALWELLRDDPKCEDRLFQRYESDFKTYNYLRFDRKKAYDETRQIPRHA